MEIIEKKTYKGIQPNRVKELREKAGIGIKEFCSMCGITRTTLWEIESGRKTEMEDRWEDIAKALNVTVHDLVK